MKTDKRITRILGIDPGSVTMGYGIIDLEGNHTTAVTYGVIKLQGRDLPDKLRHIFERLHSLIDEYQPSEVSIEKVFMHRNADSALKLGQARGAAVAACAVRGMDVFEYTANQVKQASVGKGHAAKQQVQHMVKILLCLDEKPVSDASDALAIALCHGHSRQSIVKMDAGITGINRGRMR